jgi:ribosome biogenesis protein Nip4
MYKQEKIILVPTDGLCNRMRSIASGIYIAQKLDRSLTVYWRKNQDCFADYTNLFEPVKINNMEVLPLKLVDFYLFADRKLNLFLPGKIRTFFFDTQIARFHIEKGDIFEKIKGNKIYLSSGSSMAEHYPLIKIFQPKIEIKEQINAIIQQFSTNTIGVHIRRTDNNMSIQHNSINDFCDAMDREIAFNPDTKFYLATDDAEVKTALLTTFGNKIIYHEGILSRTNVQGMQNAVIDLWCLSNTKKILGSFFSSYSEIASEMGNIKLEILNRLQ